jgi:hypothetical protein
MRRLHSGRICSPTKVSQVPDGGQGQTYWQLTDRGATPHQLTPPAKPLALGDEWYPVALLMNGEIAAVAEDYRVRVFAVAVVANATFSVLLFPLPSWFAIDRSCAAGAGAMRLRRLGIWLGDACAPVSCVLGHWSHECTDVFPMHATLSQSE